MNADRYCVILTDKVVPYFKRDMNRDKYFQQDGASPHYSLNARTILHKDLPGQWIGRRGPIEWPARSPDLTACDYWLWAYMRSKIYPDGTIYETLEELHAKIEETLQNIPMDMFRRTINDFRKRLTKCQEVNGGLFEQ